MQTLLARTLSPLNDAICCLPQSKGWVNERVTSMLRPQWRFLELDASGDRAVRTYSMSSCSSTSNQPGPTLSLSSFGWRSASQTLSSLSGSSVGIGKSLNPNVDKYTTSNIHQHSSYSYSNFTFSQKQWLQTDRQSNGVGMGQWWLMVWSNCMRRWPVHVGQWPTPAELWLFQDQFDCLKFHVPSPIPLSSKRRFKDLTRGSAF